jgi:uncharacterized protein YbcI
MDEAQQPQIGHQDRQGLELQEVTNAMVRLYKDLFGRGPTKARSNWAGPDTLVATIQNSLTPAERNMVELDEHQRVREIRMFSSTPANETSRRRSSRSRVARCGPS